MKTYLNLFFVLLVFGKASAQITNSVYLDYSSLWHFHGAGWNGIYGYETFTTAYIDGDTSVNGQNYYNYFRYVRTITNSVPVSETYQLFGPSLLREDNDHNFVYYYNGAESLYLFNDSIAAANVGDPFPALGANCNVENLVYLTIGSLTVKHLYGSVNNMTAAGIAEGIGYVGPTCALGVEGNESLVCYYRLGDSICFQTGFDPADFPEPQYMSVGNLELDRAEIIVYPNPANETFVIEGLQGNVSWCCFDAAGKMVSHGITEKQQGIVDASSWQSGIYVLRLVNENGESLTQKMVVE